MVSSERLSGFEVAMITESISTLIGSRAGLHEPPLAKVPGVTVEIDQHSLTSSCYSHDNRINETSAQSTQNIRNGRRLPYRSRFTEFYFSQRNDSQSPQSNCQAFRLQKSAGRAEQAASAMDFCLVHKSSSTLFSAKQIFRVCRIDFVLF